MPKYIVAPHDTAVPEVGIGGCVQESSKPDRHVAGFELNRRTDALVRLFGPPCALVLAVPGLLRDAV